MTFDWDNVGTQVVSAVIAAAIIAAATFILRRLWISRQSSWRNREEPRESRLITDSSPPVRSAEPVTKFTREKGPTEFAAIAEFIQKWFERNAAGVSLGSGSRAMFRGHAIIDGKKVAFVVMDTDSGHVQVFLPLIKDPNKREQIRALLKRVPGGRLTEAASPSLRSLSAPGALGAFVETLEFAKCTFDVV